MTIESLAEVTVEGADAEAEIEEPVLEPDEEPKIPPPDYLEETDGLTAPKIEVEIISEPETKPEVEPTEEPKVVKSPSPEPDYQYDSEPEPLPEPEPEPKMPPPVFAKPPVRQQSLPVRSASPPSVDKLFGEVKKFGGIAGLRKSSETLPPPAPRGFQGNLFNHRNKLNIQ